MTRDFDQLEWDTAVQEDCRQIVRLAVREDLDRAYDWTSVALVAPDALGKAAVIARQSGVIAGLPAAELALAEMDQRAQWTSRAQDGSTVQAGTTLAIIEGSARTLLTAERLLLNLIGHLSGVATLTQRYVEAAATTRAKIYDTRKTTPGWRRLEKYAVRCGGGNNHRTGLFDAILIKDNHLAIGAADPQHNFTPAQAVLMAREFLQSLQADKPRADMLIEVEAENFEQLEDVLRVAPDVVLLDNMTPEQLRQAVALRDSRNPQVQLEASGGVNLETVGQIAASGVDRISVGALTHSASWFDVALDWLA